MDEKELLHYGIPGMKWGQRKSVNEINKARRQARADNPDEEEHEDYKKTVRAKSMKSMSTKEIQEMNARIQAEKTYRELTKREQSGFEKAAREVITNVAKNSAQKFIEHYSNILINKSIDKIDKTKIGSLLVVAKPLTETTAEIASKAKTKDTEAAKEKVAASIKKLKSDIAIELAKKKKKKK